MTTHICSSRKCKNDCNGTCADHEDLERERPHYGKMDDDARERIPIMDLRAMLLGSKKT